MVKNDIVVMNHRHYIPRLEICFHFISFLIDLLGPFIFTLSKIIEKTRDDTCGLMRP